MIWPEKPGIISAAVLADIRIKMTTGAQRIALLAARAAVEVKAGAEPPPPNRAAIQTMTSKAMELIQTAKPEAGDNILEWADIHVELVAKKLAPLAEQVFVRPPEQQPADETKSGPDSPQG